MVDLPCFNFFFSKIFILFVLLLLLSVLFCNKLQITNYKLLLESVSDSPSLMQFIQIMNNKIVWRSAPNTALRMNFHCYCARIFLFSTTTLVWLYCMCTDYISRSSHWFFSKSGSNFLWIPTEDCSKLPSA